VCNVRELFMEAFVLT